MTHIHFKSSILLLLLLLFSVTVSAQGNRQFSVASFALDQLDLTAKNEQYKKMDGNGSLYAIIKVSSTAANDNLKEYRFNFGNLSHEVVEHEGKLWVYVQRNAKHVTISRQGFSTIDKYDLGTTIEAGRTYEMKLSPSVKGVYSQMVMFAVEPVGTKATVIIKKKANGASEEVFGITDEYGGVANNLAYGTYTYKVMAEGFYTSEGQFTLNDVSNTHTEKVALKAKFATITLQVPCEADIYVNGELKGRKEWTGRLNSGTYVVECRQANYRPSSQSVTIEENTNRTITLEAPTPITGILSVMSKPLGADISIDGEPQGTTPCNIPQLLIGSHTIVLAKDGFEKTTQTFDITEGQVTNLNVTLTKGETPSSVVVQESFDNSVVQKKNADISKSLVKNYKQKANLFNIIGYGAGGAMVVAGAIWTALASEGNGNDASIMGGCALAGGGLLCGGACILVANIYKNKAKRLQATSLWKQNFNLNNGSTLSASIDMLKDGVNNRQILGLGLQYSF